MVLSETFACKEKMRRPKIFSRREARNIKLSTWRRVSSRVSRRNNRAASRFALFDRPSTGKISHLPSLSERERAIRRHHTKTTAMAPTKTPPLHVLRGILRRLRVENHLGTPGGRDATRAHVLSQYRQNKTVSSPELMEQLRKIAYDYMKLKDDISERDRLYKIDTGAEVQLSPRELSRRAAARTGLQLPQLDPELEKDLKR